ncbi:helix-turn-helix transcriptional regulator [Paludibacter jiangxiensis]|uniref:Helix-turn-helix domain-containing protein n=1 Tax=Paludibacter jiangxiensis TaxID=681398 RepID=A0A171A8R9_9BACT|nr:helix-turn-helix transcriptional regulator [Paludibacter jiangxiensis]GAT63400.1 hypothetical protein PJIAN_3729 [Paludibacter jiangxiensis]
MKNNDKALSIQKEDKGDKISSLKYNVITPVNLSCFLEPVELAIFIALMHQCNVSNKPISLSMVAGFTGLSKSRVSNNIQSLERMGLVSKGRKTQNGTFYYIETENIVRFLKEYNDIKDPVTRLKIGDLIRRFSGLETKNVSAIKLFGSYNDMEVFSTDKDISLNNESTFNSSIDLLNEFLKIKTNDTWLTYQIKLHLAGCLISRAEEIGTMLSKKIEYDELKNEYYGKCK